MKRILALLALAGILAAQGSPRRYSATSGDVSLSAAATTFTIQPPATNARTWTGEAAYVYCSVACNVSQAINGTAASTTAVTVQPINPGEYLPATTTAFKASNVGTGTAVGGIIHIPAGQTWTIDLSKVTLGNTGTATNYSISTSSITGTANITIIGSEK